MSATGAMEGKARRKAPSISIGPNRNTLGLAAVLLAMLYASAGQSNGAAYILCFLVSSLAAISLLHCWANLRGLSVEAGPIRSVFAGEELVLPLRVVAQPGARHGVISLTAGQAEPVEFLGEISAQSPGQAKLGLLAPYRGRFSRIEARLASSYPLGFFTARVTFPLEQTYFVYPKPDGGRPLPLVFDPARQAETGARIDGDDFAGVREWRTGESMRHVDWKAAARGHRLLVKQWRGGAGDLLMLDWAALDGLETESRLSQLAQWIILAEHNGATYGLRLPGSSFAPMRGDAHMHACLRALAAFGEDENNSPAAGESPA